MKHFLLSATMLAVLALSQPARADEMADLKAEIAAQRQAAAAQQARLDALEKKLNAVQQQQQQPQQQATAANSTSAAKGATSTDLAYERGAGATVSGTQGSLTLYGLIDVSYVHANHANAAGDSLNSARVAWFSGNRWGLTGKRPLGDTGANVIFRLESEYESQTGNQDTAGVLFNRDAWVGVENDAIGKITLGRQNAIGRDPIASAIYGDPYGPAAPSLEEGGYTNNNNFKQLIFYAGSATGTRLNNGVVWKKDFRNGLFAGASYQFGGVAGSTSSGASETLALSYAGGAFNLAGFATSAKVGGLTDHAYSFGGNTQVGPVRLNAGYFHYTGEQAAALGNRSDSAITLSAKFAPAGKLDYELGYQNMKATGAAVNGGGNVLNAFADASAAKAVATGSRSTIYGSVFYHFDKITEVYLAADQLKLKDGYKASATNGFPSQTELAVGMRTRF